MTELMKCSKCGAVMIKEDYLQYGWYLDGKKVDCCPKEAEPKEDGVSGKTPRVHRRRRGAPSPLKA